MKEKSLIKLIFYAKFGMFRPERCCSPHAMTTHATGDRAYGIQAGNYCIFAERKSQSRTDLVFAMFAIAASVDRNFT
jgi:hypothetical protein